MMTYGSRMKSIFVVSHIYMHIRLTYNDCTFLHSLLCNSIPDKIRKNIFHQFFIKIIRSDSNLFIYSFKGMLFRYASHLF